MRQIPSEYTELQGGSVSKVIDNARALLSDASPELREIITPLLSELELLRRLGFETLPSDDWNRWQDYIEKFKGA